MGADTLGMTRRPSVIARVTASNEPSSTAQASRASTRAVTRDLGMIGRPASSRGSAMKSGRDSSPPAARRSDSSHRMVRGRVEAIAAMRPSTRNSVLSASPSPPQITSRSARARMVGRSAIGPSSGQAGKK